MRITDVDSLLKRLDRLERQQRRVKQFLTIALVFGVSAILVAAQSRFRSVIEAEEFVLKVGGEPRARLFQAPGGPTLALYDAAGKVGAKLEVGEVFSGITVGDGNVDRIHLALQPVGSTLVFFDNKGTPQVYLTGAQDGPTMLLSDATGYARFLSTK